MEKQKMRSFKLRVVKYCILDQYLFLKDPRGIFLNYVEEDEVERIIIEMYKGVCGGHHYWKPLLTKILEKGTTGLHCFKIFLQNSKLVWNVKCL